MRLRLFLGLAALSCALMAPSSASAAPPAKAGASTHKPAKKDDAAAKAHKQFLDTLKDGTTKYLAKDIPGAIEAFQAATELEPRNPLGFYYLGEAHVGNKDLPQAEAAWLKATQVADQGPAGLKVKIFFVMADLRERQKQWDDAKAAWQQYADLLSTVPNGSTYPQVSAERIASIEAMQKQDKAYEIVRKRIAEEKSAKAAAPTP
jgi:tetratricopeptide (TPR) repeat protein